MRIEEGPDGIGEVEAATLETGAVPGFVPFELHLWPKLESGAIKPIIETVVPMTDAQRAHDLVASNQTFGKVVLEW